MKRIHRIQLDLLIEWFGARPMLCIIILLALVGFMVGTSFYGLSHDVPPSPPVNVY